MKKLIELWKAETPKLYKILRNQAIALGGSLTAVLTANATIPLNMSESAVHNIGLAIAVCVFIAGRAQLTKKK